MEKINLKLDSLDLFPYKSEIPIRIIEHKCQTPKNNFSFKFPKKSYMQNKGNFNGKKHYLKNKRKDKDKNRIRQEMPNTPHNTGQYLSHIHQEFDPKKKSASLNKEIDELGCNEIISCFEDEDDDFDELGNGNLDFEFVEDKKRDRLMSMEGKDLHNFLFKSNENGNVENGDNENTNKNIIKTGLIFSESKEENDLDLISHKSI